MVSFKSLFTSPVLLFKLVQVNLILLIQIIKDLNNNIILIKLIINKVI